MKNKDRKFIQWTPSRDWSRLIVLSSKPYDSQDVCLYLEFYNFNNEKQTSPIRINYLSQLLRPQWIEFAGLVNKSSASEVKIEASFAADTLVIRQYHNTFILISLNPDWTGKKERLYLTILDNANIESLTLSGSKLYVKSDGLYYEQSVTYIYHKYKENNKGNQLYMKKDFINKTTLKNIIQCGIYDILVFDEHVKIFSNIEQLNEPAELKVEDDMLRLLQSNTFIQLDHHSIACLPQPLNDDGIRIKIIDISNDNLVMKQIDTIQLKSPLSTQASDCLFSLIKFKDGQYVVLIVNLPSKQQFYLCYKYVGENDKYEFACQQPVNGYKFNLKQIPHLPLVTINGSLFINWDRHMINFLSIDLRLDEAEIFYQDQDNISSQEVEVYHPNFKEQLCRIIEKIEKDIDIQIQSDRNIFSIEIPEFKTSIIIKSPGEYSRILIFQPSFDKLKRLIFKQPIRYKAHKVIYRDASYKICIILSTDDALYEMQMCFDHLAGATLTPLKLITNFTEAQKQHEMYLHDDFTVSLFIPAPDCSFKHFSLNSKNQKEETIEIDIINYEETIAQLSSFLYRIAHNQSISLGKLFLMKFKSIIFKNAESFIVKEDQACVFAFQNLIILFEKGVQGLIIMDDSFSVIGTIILAQNLPLSIIRIASSKDPGALECIDEFYKKFPIPIQWTIKDYKSYNERLNYYTNNYSYPMPIQFGLHEGFIPHLDLQSEKLLFYKSNQEKKDGKIAIRIEITSQRDSFIDEITNSKERKEIEDQMNNIEINLLLSYNVNTRMNLITGTKNHPEKGLIYSVLQKRLENSEIKELPMLIYNTSVDPSKYESILDILNENKAIKLARLIVSIAIQQDQIGYIYSRLYQYLEIFSANELQMFFESQIFFFKIPTDCYEEYQVSYNTLVKPYSNHTSFPQIREYMKNVETQVLEASEQQVRFLLRTRRFLKALMASRLRSFLGMLAVVFCIPLPIIPYNQNLPHNKKLEYDISDESEEQKVVPIEYFAVNLQDFTRSDQEQNNQPQKEVAKILNDLAEIDAAILEKESIKIIIDFKWDTYAQKFFSIQLGLFICFIIAFIVEVVGVSKNSHNFSNDDSNQTIPRVISIAILIPFAIYEIANIVITKSKYFESNWNLIDLLLIIVYAAYFTMAFTKPDQMDALKSLQLFIVIFSFIKFSFLIRIWTKVSFLVRMLIVVFKELLIFLFFLLLVIGTFTVMAQIIIQESGDEYKGIKLAAYFVIVLRQAVGDYDTSSIIEGTQEFKILAWLLWLLILIIGNIVFMNFIIAVVSDSYDFCMEKRVQLIYSAKLEMIQECEDLMPGSFFEKENWFPKFIIIRREQGSGEGGENSNEWFGFVAQMRRYLENETTKLKEIINRSTDNTKKEMKAGQEELKRDVAEVKTEVSEMKKEMTNQINQINQILSAVFKEQIADIKAKEVQANNNKAI